MNEHAYSLFCLRYFPNLMSGEFVNVGVALVARHGSWSVRLADDLRDMRCLFPSAQPKAVATLLAELKERLHESSSMILEPASPDDPLNVIRRRAGNLNGSLRWSAPVFEGSTSDIETEVAYWFGQLVQAADTGHAALDAASSDRGSKRPSPVHTLMEREFIRRGVIGRLRKRRIEGYFPTTFKYTYQNGGLNIFEPIQLNYKSAQAILNKAQMWRGRLDVLGDQVHMPVAFYALMELPHEPHLRSEVEAAVTTIRRAQVERVETVPTNELERFGELVAKAVGDDH